MSVLKEKNKTINHQRNCRARKTKRKRKSWKSMKSKCMKVEIFSSDPLHFSIKFPKYIFTFIFMCTRVCMCVNYHPLEG